MTTPANSRPSFVIVGASLSGAKAAERLRGEGVQAHGVRTVTSAPRGLIRDDSHTRAEFLSLARTSS